jgi:hypothetical protein
MSNALTVSEVVNALNVSEFGFEAQSYGAPDAVLGEKIEVWASVRGERKGATIYVKGNVVTTFAFRPFGLVTVLIALGAQF